MSRLRSNFQRGSLSANAASGDTTLTDSAGFTTLPVVAAPDYLMIVLDPDAVHGNPEIVKVTTHTVSATSVTVTRAQEGTSARSHNSSTTWRHVPTSTDWLRVSETAIDINTYPNATTDLATAMSQAITDIGSGGDIVLPPGAYTSGNIQLSGLSNVTIRGANNAQINWTGTGGSGLGFQLVGTNTNLAFRDLILNGDGVLANKHSPIWQSTSAGQTLNGLKVLNCRITNVMTGVLVNYDTGTLTDVLIEGNYIDNVVGTSSGQGYGINVSGPVGTAAHVRIFGNELSRTQRHAIYCSKGSGFTVVGNTSRLHRTGVADTSIRPAFVVSRVTDASMTGNVADSPSDGAFTVDTAATFNCRNVVLANNVVSLPQNAVAAFTIGTTNPATDGFPEEVLLIGNSVYQTTTGNCLRLLSGKRVTAQGNLFAAVGVTGSTSLVSIEGTGESGASSTYTDTVSLRGNTLYGTDGGGATYGVRLSGTETTAITMRFASNTINVADASFVISANITNPNVMITDTPYDGLTWSAGVDPLPSQTGPSKVLGKIINTAQGTPTVDTNPASITALSVSGNDVRGTVSFHTGASPPAAGNVLFRLVFSAAYAATPVVMLCVSNGQISVLNTYQVGTTSFKVVNGETLNANSDYTVDYLVVGRG